MLLIRSNKLTKLFFPCICTTIRVSVSGKTRWLGTQMMISNFIKSKKVLKLMAIEPDWLNGDSTDFVLSEGNWTKLNKIKDFYETMAEQIKVSQSDESSMSLLTEMIIDTRKALGDLFDGNEWISEEQKKEATQKFDERFSGKFASEYSILANVLDPKYRGRKIKAHGMTAAEATLLNYAFRLDLIEMDYEKSRRALKEGNLLLAPATNELIKCFKNYLFSNEMFASPVYGYVEGRDLNSLNWWLPFCEFQGYEHLAVVAVRLLSVPASAASVERNFSKMAWIHTKRRNHLTEMRVNKLMTIIAAEGIRNRNSVCEIPTLIDPPEEDIVEVEDQVVVELDASTDEEADDMD